MCERFGLQRNDILCGVRCPCPEIPQFWHVYHNLTRLQFCTSVHLQSGCPTEAFSITAASSKKTRRRLMKGPGCRLTCTQLGPKNPGRRLSRRHALRSATSKPSGQCWCMEALGRSRGGDCDWNLLTKNCYSTLELLWHRWARVSWAGEGAEGSEQAQLPLLSGEHRGDILAS